MCGIVGYIGNKQASPVLLEGLERLSYRGYDSAGVAVIGPEGRISVRKAKGRLENLKSLLAQSPVEGVIGIGHTRWATHGNPATSTPIPIRMSRAASRWCTTASSKTMSPCADIWRAPARASSARRIRR